LSRAERTGSWVSESFKFGMYLTSTASTYKTWSDLNVPIADLVMRI
jgi:hypothetical protein